MTLYQLYLSTAKKRRVFSAAINVFTKKLVFQASPLYLRKGVGNYQWDQKYVGGKRRWLVNPNGSAKDHSPL